MVESASLRYHGSCVMLMSIEGNQAAYLGTAVLIHSDGYILTSSHIIPEARKLGIVPQNQEAAYVPLTAEALYPVPVEEVSRDEARGIALLKLVPDLGISVPAHIIGNPDDTPVGTPLLSLGFSFAHYQLHSMISLQSILSAKLLTPNGTKVLLFDSRVHSGDIGGPVINAADERIIGIIIGPFTPEDMVQERYREQLTQPTAISQAVSIEYGTQLLRDAGADIF